ncbi:MULTISPECIES: hypothetical protein [Kitasatospora]|uniref:Secreted protein n=1 Tax=Kitasatospora cathayae TaxID=3004092 RepID=A0ABY7Q1G2_9ACTN|nr:hypothetical protein [Kitasatospora sp. HUAS 3-15]WBP86535.1 hypothetical protein O1G21_12235 [Kitasatospora sp. HUAS 3-15]
MTPRRILRTGVNTMMAAVLGLGGAALGASAAHAQDFGPDTCRQGFVWRDARPGDHVCVIPQHRTDAASDNSQAGARTLQNGFCVSSFVWREAWAGDHVCVIPQHRTDAASDNSQADDRRLAVRVWDGDNGAGRLKISGDHFNIGGLVRVEIRLSPTGSVQWTDTVTATQHGGFAGGSFGVVPGNPFSCATKNAVARATDLTSGRTTAWIPVGYCFNL